MIPEPLTLAELKELKDLNELDVFYKLLEIVSDKKLQKRVEKILRNNDTAGVDVRRHMQDVKLLADIIRDKVQIRKGVAWKEGKRDTITRAIEKEEARIKKIEDKYNS